MTQNLMNKELKIALFEPDIPQNTAAIIRTCACLGAKLEIIEPCGFLFSDKRFKRVVMDYMNEKEIKLYESSDHFFKSKKNQRIILMSTKASKSYTNFKFDKNDTIENNIKNNFVESSEILEIKEVIDFLNSNSKRGITTFEND